MVEALTPGLYARPLVRWRLELDRLDRQDRSPIRLVAETLFDEPFGISQRSEELDDLTDLSIEDSVENHEGLATRCRAGTET